MPRRNAALTLAALVALGGLTACEKQSPWVTVTAGGTVVKARASKYCRGEGEKVKCQEGSAKPVVIEIASGDVLGIDVPRSLAEDGWSAPNVFGEQVIHDHYRSLEIPAVQTGDIPLTVVRNAQAGEGEWQFLLRVK